MPKDKRLHLYLETLRQRKNEFPCPDCGLLLLPKTYEKHCSGQHAFDTKLGCVWCRNFSWKRGTKGGNVDHLLPCCRKFLALKYTSLPPSTTNVPSSTAAPSPPRLLNTKHRFPELDCFGIQHDHLPPRAHEHPRLLEVSRPRIFEDGSTDLAGAYVLRFGKKDLVWFHIMVRAPALESFLDVMDEEPTCRVLAHSCWCDGGKVREARYRQHRHLIVAAPEGHFDERVWPLVKALDRPYPNYPCKRKKPILTELHLANAMGYLSHRRSRCNFTWKASKKVPRRDNHFFLHKTLPRDFLLPLCLLWEGGVEEFLYQKYFQRASVAKMARRPMIYRDGKWRQKTKDFPALDRGLVVPVSRDLAPTSDEEKSSVSFHLMGGRKLHLERRPELVDLSDEEWLKVQADGGNRFFDVEDEQWWTPRPCQQERLNELKPLVDRVEELESEVRGVKRKHEEDIADLKNENLRRDRKIERLEKEIEGLKNEIQQLKSEKDPELRKWNPTDVEISKGPS